MTAPSPTPPEDIDPAFGNWLAGFIDGEGHFAIVRIPRSVGHRPKFTLELRADDQPILEGVQDRTGIGTIRRRRTRHFVAWHVNTRTDLAALVRLLEFFPLRAKKKRDFEIWREAVRIAAQREHTRGPMGERFWRGATINFRLEGLKRKLETGRQYEAPPDDGMDEIASADPETLF